jgi:hypothetical protein
VGNAMLEVAIRMDVAKVPMTGRYGVMYPTFFAEAKKLDWANSRDFNAQGANNADGLESMKLFGITWFSLPTIFNTDRTSGSDNKYLGNFKWNASEHGPVWGVAFQDEGPAMHEIEKPNGKIIQFDVKRLYIPTASRHKGYGCLRPNQTFAIVGDLSSS